jgi:sensor domain CHASE-containing protein
MKITRNVILDLLPLYLGDEVSDDTRALVIEYMNSDPELVELAERSRAATQKQNVPIPLTKEDKMEAYKEAKHALYNRVILFSAIIGVVLFALAGTVLLLAFFMLSS